MSKGYQKKLYVTVSDKKGPDAVLSNFHCDVVKFATSHNKNEHLLTAQMHINEPHKVTGNGTDDMQMSKY